MSSLMEWALWYAKGGLSVFPLVPKGKDPIVEHGFYNATKDPNQIRKWWDENPSYNIGIACGKPSMNIVVIDLDYHPERCIDGRETLEEWEDDHGKLPEETWTATSGSGGVHLYYRGDGSETCSIDKEHKTGIDIRANGGYIVACPSVHPDGGHYEWDIAPGESKLASVNDLVHDFIQYIFKMNGKDKKFHLSGDPVVIEQGTRNGILFDAACSMQATGYPDEVIDVAIRELNKVSCKPPLTESELEKTLGSAKEYNKGGTLDRWKTKTQLMKQELLQDLRKYLKKN